MRMGRIEARRGHMAAPFHERVASHPWRTVELLPALDGHGVDIVYASTTKLSRADCSELSEYVMAWGSDREVPVRWSIASLGGDA